MTGAVGTRAGALQERSALRWTVRILAGAAAYFVLARLGLLLSYVPGGASPVWPPSGFAIAFLVLYGPSHWPAVTLGILAAMTSIGADPAANAGIALGNTLEALLGSLALSPRTGFRPSLDRLRDVLALLVPAGLMAPAVSATIGVTCLMLVGSFEPSRFAGVWWSWWVGNVLSVLILTPLLLVWGGPPCAAAPPVTSRRVLIEVSAAAALLLLFIAFGVFSEALSLYREAYFFFPILAWAALRHGQRGAVLGSFFVSTVAISAIAGGVGPLTELPAHETVLYFQTFIGVVTSTVLLLGGAIAERGLAEEALRASEMRFRRAYDSNIIGIAFGDLSGALTDANAYFLRCVGLDRADLAAGGANWLRGAGDEEAPSHACITEEVRRHGIAGPFEKEYQHEDGSRVPVQVVVARLGDAGTDCVAFLVDLTARKYAERELRMLQHELEHRVEERTADLVAANRELESYSYTVSHDLRAPLRALDGFSAVLLADHAQELPSEAKSLVESIRRNARRMGQLIDDLLAFSHVSRYELTTADIDLDGLVHDVVEDLRRTPEGMRARIEVHPLPPCRGDVTTVRQVLFNLLHNALKYSRNRADALVEVGALPGEEGGCVYFVRDNGVGFDMRYADKLFGVFSRLHGPEYEGTGVGLAIVRRIIERHGGKIWVEAEPDKGATFFFTLP